MLNIRKFLKALRILPKASTEIDAQGELEVLSTDGKLRFHNGVSASPVVTEAHSATLTNKTIDGDDNTLQDIGISSLKTVLGDANKMIARDGSGAVVSSATLPTGVTIDGDVNTVQDLALSSLKTVLGDANKFISRDGSGIVVSGPALPSGAVVGSSDSQTLTNKTIDGDDNTVQDLALSSLKTNLTDASKFLVRDASGIVVSNTKAVPVGDVVGTSDSQTLSSKTISGGTHTGSIDGSASTNVNLATTNTASTVDIGTGTGANTINIGGANSTVNFTGTVNNNNVTNLNVTDKLITINDGGGAASGGNSGFEIEEGGSATGYVQTSTDRNSFQLKAPNTAGVATITPGAGGITLNQSSHDAVTLASVGSSPNSSGASLSGQQLTLQPADATNAGVVSTSAQTFAGVKTFNSAPLLKAGIDVEDPGAGTNKVTITSPTLASDWTFTLPTTAGSSGQVLSTNGSGSMSWVNNASTTKYYAIHQYDTTNGYGSTATCIPKWSNNTQTSDPNSILTVTNSATQGFSVTANQKLRLTVHATFGYSTSQYWGFTKNASGSDLTTDPSSIARSKQVLVDWQTGSSENLAKTISVVLETNDVIRLHAAGTTISSNSLNSIWIEAETL